MLSPADFYNLLQQNDVRFFTGVPDSLLKDICAYVTDHAAKENNIIAANEGNAVGIAAGRYLATEEISMVYMQNSGLGNIVNPLTSLVDPLVYSIPMLLLVGWRGEPGVKDEPQHVKQGLITLELLDVLGVKYSILPKSLSETEQIIKEAMQYMLDNQAPYALVVPANTFEPYTLQTKIKTSYPFNREEAIKLITARTDKNDIMVSTTGKTSRELYEYRIEMGDTHERDFLTVGSMGHSSQIALGIALAKPQKKVWCLDGDGAFIMHMGGLAIIGEHAPANLKHIILNNGAHDSVGGQPTVCHNINVPAIAKACGYQTVLQATTEEEIIAATEAIKQARGPALLEIKINKGARKDLGRPKTTPQQNKATFMAYLANSD
jgi:phosphonopyruvate decarboxylase